MPARNLLDSFETAVQALLAAPAKSTSKADSLKDWFKKNFSVAARVAQITEDRQIGMRLTEQFDHRLPVVVFICSKGINFETLEKRIRAKAYPELVTVLVVSVANGSLSYEHLYSRSDTAFTKWATQELDLKRDDFKVQRTETGSKESSHASRRTIADKDIIIHAPRQLIIYGAPGTGKSWWIKGHTAGCDVIRTTFHPDSDYSTFVGAYKPSMEDDGFKTVVTTGEVSPSGSIAKKDGLITQKRIVYKFVAQAFLKAYVEAWKKMAMGGTLAENAKERPASANSAYSARGSTDATERVPPVYLVIEEINRGNCAQIFGDLFQLLDRNDEGFSEYEIAADDDLRRYLAEAFKSVRGSALAAAGDSRPPNADAMNCVPSVVAEKLERVFKGEILLLPENLFIWATMNTSDQSLFPIDSAFKRRWEWKYMPIHDAQKGYRIAVGADAYDWWDFLDKANALVQDFTDSEDKKLGYFFCKANPDGTIPLERFVGKVVFYLWNDVFRDVGFDHEVFSDGAGGRLLFKSFFNPDGSPKAEAVRQFLANLGVAKVSTDEKTADGAASADEALAEEGASA